jgi:hypothetical protein
MVVFLFLKNHQLSMYMYLDKVEQLFQRRREQ